MGHVLSSLPVGERVGLAFSGGLDTSVAVAWMREKGAIPYAYTADLGQYDEPDLAGVPDRALRLRRRGGPPRRLPRRARARGSGRAAVRRLPHRHRRARRTSTPRRSAARSPARCSCGPCTTTASTSGATAPPTRATTSSASTATACSSNPTLRIYKPWLDPPFVDELGGRAEMSEWLAARGLPVPGLGREGVLDRRQHLGRDPRGQARSRSSTTAWTSSSRSWACATGTRQSPSSRRT